MPTIPRETRKWIYIVVLAIIPLLVVRGLVTASEAPLWVALAGAILAPALALNNLPPKE